MTATPNRFDGAEPIKRQPSSGLSILVVGGGIAGLGFAIEAYRKGHNIRVIDRRPNFDDYGRRENVSCFSALFAAKNIIQVILSVLGTLFCPP